jgi:hypothetical protein
MSKYQEYERTNAPKRGCFNNDEFGGIYKKTARPFVLKNWENNFYKSILNDGVIQYFKENEIAWWGGGQPTGHILSSQIACINHLFAIRKCKNTVLAVAKNICQDIDDVIKIENDKDFSAYISFEVVSDKDHLNEKYPTRGSNCTSLDALILAKIKEKTILIPIEWKYTEFYGNTDKSIEDSDKKSVNYKKGDEVKGKKRLCRYSNLITNSKQLSIKKDNYKNSVYFFEPFYQLMRQTLWAEQMIANKATETIKADDFIHVHIVPNGNKELLQYQYPVSEKGMLDTWQSCLSDKDKYKLIEPKNLLANIDKAKHKELIDYLSIRYWNE